MTDSLWFRELKIRRMPGFPSGGIGLTGLCSGINLVRDLNASGKTTTARALQGLLWRNAAPDRASVEGRFELGDERWLVDVDGSRVEWQRDGHEASPPPLPPSEHRSRYYLSLHELLRAEEEDRELAEHIRVEMHAGYDVPGAADRLGFGAGGRKHSLVEALEDARQRRMEAQDAADRLQADRRGLEQHRRRLEELEREAAAARALERALDLARAREAVAEAKRTVATFSDAVESLRGDEVERLKQWADAEQGHMAARGAARQAARKAEAALKGTGVGDEPPDRALLRELEEKNETVREIEREIRASEDALAEARAERERSDRELGVKEGQDGEAAAELDPALPSRLDDFLRRAEKLRGERAQVDARLAELGDDTAGEVDEPEEKLQDALRVLREWLRAPGPAEDGTRFRKRLLLAATVVLAVVGGVALAVGFGGETLSWLLIGAGGMAAFTALTVFVALALRPEQTGADPRPSLQEEATRLGYVPNEWTTSAVKETVDELERAVVQRRVADVQEEERGRLRSRREALEEEEAALEEERIRLAEELGVTPPADDLSLHALGSRLLARDRASRQEAAAKGRLGNARERLGKELGRAREILGLWGYEPEDGDALAGARAELQERCDRHAEARRELADARGREEEAERALEELTEARDALFERLSLEGDEREADLRSLVQELEGYREATAERDGACRDRDTARAALRDMADSGDRAAGDLLESELPSPDELEHRSEAAEEADQNARKLREEIARIEERLSEARHQHELEETLAREEATRAELEDQRGRDVEDEIGAVLAEWVRSRSATENHPAVFNRARELLVQITRGRYELMMSDDDPADFRAFDHEAGRGRALDELSDGTRLQLLLAVRIAFVETQEAGAAAPLLLDEVLANSDAHRAQAIIDACIALAENGRQIFYFTAQADEVAKWRAALEHSEVEWVETGLTDSAEDGAGFRWTAEPVEADAVPAPEGRSLDEYGRLLDVPVFDPWANGVGGLHLWYVVDDVETLHQLLRLGISTWGQLETFAERAGAGTPAVVRRAAVAARGRAELCHRFAELRRRGRGTPVDRTVLVESGAVSERFIDDVSDLCRELEGRGDTLVAALEEKRVSGFHKNKREELRSYLLDQGHISQEESLPDEQILLELTAAAHRMETGLDTPEIHTLVERLARGPS